MKYQKLRGSHLTRSYVLVLFPIRRQIPVATNGSGRYIITNYGEAAVSYRIGEIWVGRIAKPPKVGFKVGATESRIEERTGFLPRTQRFAYAAAPVVTASKFLASIFHERPRGATGKTFLGIWRNFALAELWLSCRVISARRAFHFSDRSQRKHKHEGQLTHTVLSSRHAAPTSLRTSCLMLQACIRSLIQKYPFENTVQHGQKINSIIVNQQFEYTNNIFDDFIELSYK